MTPYVAASVVCMALCNYTASYDVVSTGTLCVRPWTEETLDALGLPTEGGAAILEELRALTLTRAGLVGPRAHGMTRLWRGTLNACVSSSAISQRVTPINSTRVKTSVAWLTETPCALFSKFTACYQQCCSHWRQTSSVCQTKCLCVMLGDLTMCADA